MRRKRVSVIRGDPEASAVAPPAIPRPLTSENTAFSEGWMCLRTKKDLRANSGHEW